MKKTDVKYEAFVRILDEELVLAMGCTEPIALAYAAAKAKEALGKMPDRVLLQVSGSIIKNVKSVVVPNTGNMKGMQIAVAAGIVAGRPEQELQVIAEVAPDEIGMIQQYARQTPISVEHIETGHVFEIVITVFCGDDYAKVHICDHHTNIVLVEVNGKVLQQADFQSGEQPSSADRSLLSLQDIWEFATTCDVEDIRPVLERQISYNSAIADEGLRGDYGAGVGKVLLRAYGASDVRVRARARAAAGSDARMNGCELPVVINSGSGNQGITCSIPVIEFARELGSSHEQLLRALALSNLIAIHEKSGIGTLSAYCGAVSAGAGAGAGIAYLQGGGLEAVEAMLTNTLATVSGIVCDGAKASCASKIAEAVDMGILGYEMWKDGKVLQPGDGLVGETTEKTIRNIGRLGRDGMAETNKEIIRMMISE